MNIGFYTPNYPGLTQDGGIGTYTRALGHGLTGLGHNVHILTPGDGTVVEDGKVHVHFVQKKYLRGIDALAPGAGACWLIGRAMRRLAKLHGLDIIEFPNWEGCGLFLQKMVSTPMVVRLSTSSLESQVIDGTPPTRWHRWDVRRERWFARSADELITHSDAHRRLMSSETGIPENRIRVIPLGVEVFPEWVRPRRPLGPASVVYLGRLEHRKGTIELLQAIPSVLRFIPDSKFILIGADRPHCPGGRTHAQYLDQEFPIEVRRQVTVVGPLPQPEVDRLLQTADVFVAPSRYESFGLIFLEAMRWGTPVIGTTAGGIPEIVEHGRSGLLVPPERAHELARAIVQLLMDAGYRSALGNEGRKRIELDFSLSRMTQGAVELYEQILSARRNPCRRQLRKPAIAS